MESIWERGSFGSRPDLVVVGAGITGLFTAWHAKQMAPRLQVMVLERGLHPAGASVKNAGFACFGSPSELLRDLQEIGREAALARVRERWLGLQELRRALGDAAMGFVPVGGYEVFPTEGPAFERVREGLGELNRELRDITGTTVFSLADDKIAAQGLHAAHLVFNPLEGSVDSGRLMCSLLEKVRAAGVDVRFGNSVEAWNDTGHGIELRLAGGPVLGTGQVVLATNGFTASLVPGTDIGPGRGQVLLTSAIQGLELKGTFHMEEGYYYFRDLGGRVLFGGGRNLDKQGEATTDEGTTPLVQDTLEHLLRTVILPGMSFNVEQRWSGVMGFRRNGGPPVVEQLSPHAVLAAGLGGIGVAIGIRVARRAAELALGSKTVEA